MSVKQASERQLDLSWGTSANQFRIFVQTESGFFGLSELRSFAKAFQPYAQKDSATFFILDFSGVRMWDISAVLWLTVALHHYRQQLGLQFRLRLPDPASDAPGEDVFARSADYLRRWEFKTALQNIDADADSLLVSEQRGYFETGPVKYYLDRKVKDESNVLQSLISRRLVQIRNLTDPNFAVSASRSSVSPLRISQCVKAFQAARMGDILTTQCGIEHRKADLFADQMLTEALMNVLEHPNATVGLVSLSVMGATKELILAVVDNGESIADTIYSRFKTDHSSQTHTEAIPESVERRGEIIEHATKAGVTSKAGKEAEGAGMGLAYIKEDTVEKFGGKLQIISHGVSIKFSAGNDRPIVEEWPHLWKGNLLRLAIPLTKLRA
jgi:hypothetical protein